MRLTSPPCARPLAARHRDVPGRPGWADGSDVSASPRQVLRRQLARLQERGWSTNASTELEFLVFRDTYEEAWKKGYRDLNPANLYNVDYSLLGTARIEPLIRRIRNSMLGAGLQVENSKGSATSASTRSTSATPTPCAAPTSIDLQERSQGDRRPGGDVDQLHSQVQRARGQLVPHPLSLFDDEGPLFHRDRPRSSPSSPDSWRRFGS